MSWRMTANFLIWDVFSIAHLVTPLHLANREKKKVLLRKAIEMRRLRKRIYTLGQGFKTKTLLL